MTLVIQYFKTMLVSGSGALLSLIITTLLTEFVLGRSNYFFAYLIGVSIGIVLSFVLLSRNIFSKGNFSARRFSFFLLYMSSLIVVQSILIKYFVALFGVNWYLPIIISTMGIISLFSFGVYKYVIFE